jgi:hypothetical protein
VSDLLSLPLSRLDRPLKVHSRILGGDLWVVPSDLVGQPFDAPVYTPNECRILLALDLSPAEMRAAHLAKIELEGDLVLPAEADALRRLYVKLLRRYRTLEQRLDSQADEASLLQAARHLSYLLDHAETLEHGYRELP